MPTPALRAEYYPHWGAVQISLANLLVIAAMLVVFIAALTLPFPGGMDDSDPGDRNGADQ
jgi:hypothetical protein